MNRGTKKINSYSTHFLFFSISFVFSFFLFNVLIYRIIEYVQLRLMLGVMKPSTETNHEDGGGVCVCKWVLQGHCVCVHM